MDSLLVHFVDHSIFERRKRVFGYWCGILNLISKYGQIGFPFSMITLNFVVQ